VAEALAMLKDPDVRRRVVAAGWLAQQRVDEFQRAEVARALDPLLNDAQTREAGAKALVAWATKENVPSLLKVLDVKEGNAWRPAMSILGKLKDERAVAPLVGQMADGLRRGEAVNALRALGPMAQKQVLKSLHHKDPGVRLAVAGLLRGYNTPESDLVGQSIEDLRSTDKETRRLAADDLARRKVDENKHADASLALEPLLADADGGIRTAAVGALKVWATKDNIPALLRVLDKDPTLVDKVLDVLVKFKDDRVYVVLARCLLIPNYRAKASKGLKDMGPAAEKVVVPLLLNPDVMVRKEACHILGAIGTKASIPYLANLARRDPATSNDAKSAQRAILTSRR
jgi:HEAT repeat protein